MFVDDEGYGRTRWGWKERRAFVTQSHMAWLQHPTVKVLALLCTLQCFLHASENIFSVFLISTITFCTYAT